MQKKQYDELIAQLNELNHHYYTLDKPLVSDKEYDKLYDELIDIEKEYPDWVNAESPSQRVGGDTLSIFEEKEHTTLLYSLQKSNVYEDLEKFFADVLKSIKRPFALYTLELKIDGIAVVIRYEDGKYTEARTRGNGRIGEIMTDQVRTIRSVPMTIPHKGVVEVQGEVYMPNSKFQELNAQIETDYREKLGNPKELTESETAVLKDLKFKNARNATGGSLRNRDAKVTASRGLNVFLYNVSYIEEHQFASQVDMMAFLKDQGFRVNPYFFQFESLVDIKEKIEEMVALRPSLGYDIDGMVIKVDDTNHRDLLGFTSKHPKWATAWKFDADEAETLLREIVIETGRTGKINPVGLLNPVDIAGSTVSRATLNNFDWIEQQGLKYALGSVVLIRKANDIIPEILSVVDTEPGQEIKTPTNCPSCEGVLVKEKTKDGEGVHLYCLNIDECPAQQIEKIIHFGSRNAMNIDTFAEKTAEQLWDAGLIRNVVDLYKLKMEDLLTLERFGEQKALNLLNAIEKSKERPLEAFLLALGIRKVGTGTAERLLRYYDSIEQIMEANLNELMEIEDIGDVVATNLYEYFHNPKNKATLEELKSLGVKMEHKKAESASNVFEGMVFVVTGTMPSGVNRNTIEAKIKANGGKVSKSVSAKTTFLVAGDEAGAKLTKAEAIEAKTNRKIILSEEEFLNKLTN